MSSSVGFLDFFILEAGEYVEQLDGLFARAGASGPDGEAVQRAARSLRGSATMAKLPAFAELAHALERMGRARRDGQLQWDARLRGAAVAAVDELKLLLRAARAWSDVETQRATERTAELMALLPTPRVSVTPATPSATSSLGFLASEMANIAAGLELVLTRPEDGAGVAMVLRRVRALRGVAAIKDLPPMVAQVLEAAEQAAQPLDAGQRTLGQSQRGVLSASSEVLRAVAESLRNGAVVDAQSEPARRFGDALDVWLDSAGEGEKVVPIATLFHDDAGPHLVSASASPPTSASARFRLELVSQGEHLQRLADEASRAHDDAARERYRRELRRALRGVRALAESFEERQIVSLSEVFLAAGTMDDATLSRLRAMSALLSEPSLARETLDERLRALTEAPSAAAPAEPVPTAASPEPAAAAQPAPVKEPEPASPPSAAALLERGLAGLSLLDREPLGAPAPVEQPIVPIDTLIYRGRAAVRRALELREEMRRTGGAPTAAAVEELFDLMELALLDEAVA